MFSALCSAASVPYSSSKATSSVALLTSIPIQCFMFVYFWVTHNSLNGAEHRVLILTTLIGREPHIRFKPQT